MTQTGMQIEFRVRSGPELGPGLQETDTMLRIDMPARTALMTKARPPADAEGEPIGSFYAAVDAPAVNAIEAAIRKIDWRAIPPATQGGPGASVLSLRVSAGTASVESVFTSRDVPIIDLFDPVLNQFYALMARLNAAGRSALRIRARHVGGTPAGAFELVIENAGITAITIANPHHFPRGNADRWAGVQIAEFPPERPGFTAPPLVWERHPIGTPPTAGPGPAHIVIGPRQSHVVRTAPWSPPKRATRYLVQGVWSDYEGPESIDGVAHVRGAAFAQAIELKIP